MPNYDLQCDKCGKTAIDVLERISAPVRQCGECDGMMQRVIIGGAGDRPARANSVNPDDIPGGVEIKHVICNDDGSPRRFYTKSSIEKAANRAGYSNYVRHVPGSKDSDKSKHTVRWDTMSPRTEEERLRRWHEHEEQLQRELSHE